MVHFVHRWMTKEPTTSSATSEEPVLLDGPRRKDLSVVQGHTCNDWDFVGTSDLDLLALVLVVVGIVISLELLSSKVHWCLCDGDDSSESNEEEKADSIGTASRAETMVLPKHVKFSDAGHDVEIGDWNTADRVKMGRRKVKRRLLSPKCKSFKAAPTSAKRPRRKTAARMREIMATDEVIVLSP